MMHRVLFSVLLSLWAICGPSWVLAQQSAGDRNAASLKEKLAQHVGTLAYVYGYPMVDMRRQMHNETNRVSPTQQAYAPVNHF